MKTLLILIVLCFSAYALECDSANTGLPLIITKDRLFGLTTDTTYTVCKCYGRQKNGFWVSYYSGEEVFYPYEQGWHVKKRKLK